MAKMYKLPHQPFLRHFSLTVVGNENLSGMDINTFRQKLF